MQDAFHPADGVVKVPGKARGLLWLKFFTTNSAAAAATPSETRRGVKYEDFTVFAR